MRHPIAHERFPKWHPLKGTFKVWFPEIPVFYAFGTSLEAATAELYRRYPALRPLPDDDRRNYSCGL